MLARSGECVAREQKYVRQPNGRSAYTEHFADESSNGQIRSRSAVARIGNARRFGESGPPRARTARRMATISMLVTYGSRPVIPKRQHSLLAGQLECAWELSTSA